MSSSHRIPPELSLEAQLFTELDMPDEEDLC